MNWYSYWYFTIYSIYKRFSKDSYFDIFATSMFSFFIANFLFCLLIYLSISLNFIEFMKKNGIALAFAYSSVFILNYIYFLPKQKQLINYSRYKEVQTTTKSFIALLFSTLSVVLLIITLLHARKYTLN